MRFPRLITVLWWRRWWWWCFELCGSTRDHHFIKSQKYPSQYFGWERHTQRWSGGGGVLQVFVVWTFSERCYQSSIINYQSSDYQKGRILMNSQMPHLHILFEITWRPAYLRWNIIKWMAIHGSTFPSKGGEGLSRHYQIIFLWLDHHYHNITLYILGGSSLLLWKLKSLTALTQLLGKLTSLFKIV